MKHTQRIAAVNTEKKKKDPDTFTIRMHPEHIKFITRAAESERMTRTIWIEALVLPAAVQALGEPLPAVPMKERRPYHGDEAAREEAVSIAEEAARAHGVDPEAFINDLLRQAPTLLAKLPSLQPPRRSFPPSLISPAPVSARAVEAPPQRIAAGSGSRRK